MYYELPQTFVKVYDYLNQSLIVPNKIEQFIGISDSILVWDISLSNRAFAQILLVDYIYYSAGLYEVDLMYNGAPVKLVVSEGVWFYDAAASDWKWVGNLTTGDNVMGFNAVSASVSGVNYYSLPSLSPFTADDVIKMSLIKTNFDYIMVNDILLKT